MKLETRNLNVARAARSFPATMQAGRLRYIFCLCLLAGFASAADREFSKVWKVETSPAKKLNLDWFQGDSIAFNLTSTQNGSVFDLTDAVVVWEITGWTDYTNIYAAVTGTVSDVSTGTSTYSLSSALGNLPDGTYLGYAKSICSAGTNITSSTILCWQRINVEWSPSGGSYSLVTPSPYYYTKTEADVLHAALADAIAAAVPGNYASVSNSALSAVQTESDPIWNAASGSVYTAIDGKTDQADFQTLETAVANSSNNWNLAETAVQPLAFSDGYLMVGSSADNAIIFDDETQTTTLTASDTIAIDTIGIDLKGAYMKGVEDPLSGSFLGDRDYNDERYASIDAVPTNVVLKNLPASVTNDSSWTGWTIEGDMTASNTIYLTVGESMTSPVQTNGIADYALTNLTTCELDVSAVVGTNTVSLPYRGTDGQLKIEVPIQPGSPAGVTHADISRVEITGYADLAEAAETKYVSNLRRIDAETAPDDLTRKLYVDGGDAASVSTASDALAAYAADADKTVICSRVRIGKEYSVEGDGDPWQLAQFCSIDGTGELTASANGLSILKNGRVLLSSRADVTGAYITAHNFAAWTFDVATNGVEATPFLEYSPTLIAQDWTALPDEPTLTNGAYSFTVASPPTNTTGYVRAVQPVGTSAIIIDADVLDVQGVISNSLFQTLETTVSDSSNVWNSVTGTVSSIVLNSVTNTPTAGQVDLGELVTALQYSGTVNGTNRTATLTYDFANNVWQTEVTDE